MIYVTMVFVFFIILGVIGYFIWDHFYHKDFLPISGRYVFITGCDSGFGRALTHHFDSLGCHVFAACYTNKGQEELRQGTKQVTPVRLDVGDTESIKKAFEEVRRALDGKPLWAIVNNAGVGGIGGPIEFISRQDYENTFRINVVGMAEVARIFLPLLKESRGRLVNCVSMAGRVAFPGMGQYVASKFAMEGLSDVQRRELAKWGIKVSILNPGLFRTGLGNLEGYAKAKQEQWESVDQSVREDYGEAYWKQSTQSMQDMMTVRAATDLSPVLKSYTHAVFAAHPRRHYLCGKDSELLCTLSLLSGWVLDKFMQLRRQPVLPQRLAN